MASDAHAVDLSKMETFFFVFVVDSDANNRQRYRDGVM